MATAFKLNKDGTVSVFRKVFAKTISRDEFACESIKMDFDEFLAMFKDRSIRESLMVDMSRLKRASRLSRIGPNIVVKENGKIEIVGCYMGILCYKGFYKGKNIRNAALNYGRKIYGEDHIDELIKSGFFEIPKFSKNNDDIDPDNYVKYYMDGGEISKEDYQEIRQIIENLSKIRDIKNPLDKSEQIITTSTKRR